MSPPNDAAQPCDAAQRELHALLLDGESPTAPVAQLSAHVAVCDRCARALAHDRALRRALARLRGADSAPDTLRDRLRTALVERARAAESRDGPGGRSRPS